MVNTEATKGTSASSTCERLSMAFTGWSSNWKRPRLMASNSSVQPSTNLFRARSIRVYL
jgi:hypothetical protein